MRTPQTTIVAKTTNRNRHEHPKSRRQGLELPHVLRDQGVSYQAYISQVSHVRGACRHCHGIDHAYQWIDENEFREACAAIANPSAPDVALRRWRIWIRSDGEAERNLSSLSRRGRGRVRVADTAKLEGSARLLFAGAKQTREGVEVKLHDQMKALEMVARHLGMYNDKLTLKGDSNNPLAILIKEIQAIHLSLCISVCVASKSSRTTKLSSASANHKGSEREAL